MLIPNPFFNEPTHSFASFFRNRPWSIRTAKQLCPTALLIKQDITVESTPPLTPTMIFSLLHCSLIILTCSSIRLFGVQFFSHSATLKRKLFNNIFPSSVCETSGWNCVAILVWFLLIKPAITPFELFAIIFQSS